MRAGCLLLLVCVWCSYMKYTFTVLRSNESTYTRAAHSLRSSANSCPRCDNCAHMQQNVSPLRESTFRFLNLKFRSSALRSWKFIDAYRVYWHFNHTWTPRCLNSQKFIVVSALFARKQMAHGWLRDVAWCDRETSTWDAYIFIYKCELHGVTNIKFWKAKHFTFCSRERRVANNIIYCINSTMFWILLQKKIFVDTSFV